MKAYDFINQNIGNLVYLLPNGDLKMNGELRGFIYDKTPLTLIRLSKGGLAVVRDSEGNDYFVPPRNVREVGN